MPAALHRIGMSGDGERPCARKPRGAEQHREQQAQSDMRADIGVPRLRRGGARGAGPRDQLRDLGRQRPAQDDDAGEHGRDRHRAGRSIGAPGDGDGRAREQR